MPNIYQNIDKNKKDTFIVIITFISFITFLSYFIGEYLVGGEGIFYLSLAFLFSGISGFYSYYNSDKIVLGISRARELTYDESNYVHKLVENLCIASGLPKPRIFVIDDSAMNAFATGRDKEHAVICLTSGIIERLEKRELEGVIAHEMAHIGNRDILLMSVVSVLVGSITLLSNWFFRGNILSGRKRDNRNGLGLILIIGIVLLIISPIIASMIKLAISRTREYLADSTASIITRYPKGLADALLKISQDQEILEVSNSATAHLYISSPLKSGALGFMGNLFNTHPPIEDRIQRLLNM